MSLIINNLGDLFAILAWAALWALGGVWMTRRAFNLHPNEQALVGLAVGLTLENWLANLIGRFLSVPAAFWLSAGLVFLAGLAISLPLWRKNPLWLVRIPISPLQWAGLIGLAFVLITVGRGLAILDDYQNLPMTSIIATGDIPPHFALDPKVIFDYHYGTLLFAAQLMRVGGLHAWNSIDIVRGFAFALALFLSFLWVRRVTGSKLAGLVAILMGMFAGGTRWLMLLLPDALLKQISANLHMIGSAAQTANTFYTALPGPWAVNSGATWGFPFAFANGINTPSIWTYHAGAGALAGLIGGFLLLTHNRWRGWPAALITTLSLAAIPLNNETTFIRLCVGFVIVLLLFMLMRRTTHLPATLTRWFWMLLPAGLIALVQGGVLTGIAAGLLARLSGQASGSSYFSFGFSLFWPPALLSSHLGSLPLFNPYTLLTALFEIGPVILLLPFALIYGVKAFRSGRWYEAFLIVLPIISVVTMVIQYTGNAGPTALNRVQGMLIGLASGNFAVAGMWLWARGRSETARVLAGSLLSVVMFGGVVLFGFELLAAVHPVRATFVDVLDARVEADYWNRLEPDALVFDSSSSRSATIFGRKTDAGITWYESKPAWEALVKAPNPANLRAAGFDYVYLDQAYWNKLGPTYQQALIGPCVKLVKEYDWDGPPSDFRRLLDIRQCGR